MTSRTRTLLGRTILVIELVLVMGLIVLMIGVWPLYRAGAPLNANDAYLNMIVPLIGLAYVSIGVLIVIRAGNVLGWLLCGLGFGITLGQFGDTYTLYALVEAPGSLPGSTVVVTFQMAIGLAAACIGPIFLLFPSGTVSGRFWRTLLWVVPSAIVFATLVYFLRSDQAHGVFEEFGIRVPNTLHVEVLSGFTDGVGSAAGVVGLVGTLACAFSILVRFRRSEGDERQQIRWLAYVGATALLLFLSMFAIGIGAENSSIADVLWFTFFLTLGLGIPVACGVAVLRYHLYDLDLVVKKTVVFTIIAVFITVLYVAALALATISTVGAIAGALIFVLTFNMVRRRARKVADRIVYGKRATPFEVMSDFSERMGETYSIDDVLPRMTELLTGSTGASEARVWLRSGSRLSPVACSPPNAPAVADRPLEDGDRLPAFEADVSSYPVTHQGDLLGAITLRMPANDPMDPSKERLVHGLASQAGLVLRNVALVQDVRASRRRLVAAQDEERRRLERNIHDGAQQQLVAMSVKIRLAEQLVEREPGKAREMLAGLQSDATGALDDLRDLARGIYPPLLADKGLPDALAAQARRSATPIAVEPDGIGRYSPEIEATVYFCCLEAMQNIAKYAAAARSTIRLAQRDGALVFEVTDEGVGFDVESTRHGSGLQGMADRLDAVGGTLEVRSRPGTGTTVRGLVPAALEQDQT